MKGVGGVWGNVENWYVMCGLVCKGVPGLLRHKVGRGYRVGSRLPDSARIDTVGESWFNCIKSGNNALAYVGSTYITHTLIGSTP